MERGIGAITYKRVGILVNPVAGNGFAKQYYPLVYEKLKTGGVKEILVEETKRPMEGSEIARRFVEAGCELIVIVGGDGTINEVIQDIDVVKEVSIGVVPAGSGNDFVKTLGFNERFSEKDWQAFLFHSFPVKVDVGVALIDNSVKRFFLNGIGVGFDSLVAEKVKNSKLKWLKGKFKYFWYVLKELVKYKAKRLKIYIKEKVMELRSFLVTIGIGRSFGGGFKLLPNAIINDGLLDVCIVRDVKILKRFAKIISVLEGTHITDKDVNYFKGTGFKLELEEKHPIHLDGEVLYSKSLEINLVPRSLKVLINPLNSPAVEL